ncbi:hypothetical protein ColLi_03871 [Colletotrichum liriopes]|uniref:Uncharacterized protein n=1 Tax=Colletotrichum liriopes TaxID=708192 RepID=A0AA37GHG0_9PEZI|nr:hypothetical protein ColLi_03871 [Colletotrichum liriopes]
MTSSAHEALLPPHTEKFEDTPYESASDHDSEEAMIMQSHYSSRSRQRPCSRWIRVVLLTFIVTAFIISWAATISLAWKAATERAESSCSVKSWPHKSNGGISSSGGNSNKHTYLPTGSNTHGHEPSKQGNVHHHSNSAQLLHVPGYRLAYNSTYCNGVKDPEGARRRDCVFDPVHGGWVPRLCHDEDLYKQFTTQNDWDWYLDENRTIPITQDAVWRGEGGGRTWTKDDFHFRHCEFIIKTLFKNGIGKAKPLGFKVLDVGHLEHCLDRLINSNTPEIRNAYTEEVVWTKSAECYERVESLEVL